MPSYKRIVVEKDDVSGDRIKLSARNRAYVHDVLRMKPGDRLIASNGRKSFLIRLNSLEAFQDWADIEKQIECSVECVVDITLAFGCVRPDPMEQIFRHCTELGVQSFVPIVFERCNRRPNARKSRWEHIIESACSQSGRSVIPRVTDPVTLKQFLGSQEDEDLKIFLSADAGAQSMYGLMQHLSSATLTILVGPEGGLTANEILQVQAQSFFEACLSPLTLRTETAAIVATGIAVSRAQMGDSSLNITNHS